MAKITWSRTDDERLIDMRNRGKTTSEIGKAMERTQSSVIARLGKLRNSGRSVMTRKPTSKPDPARDAIAGSAKLCTAITAMLARRPLAD